VSRQPQNEDQSALFGALATGRATLILGQRHSPGLLDALHQDIAEITAQPANQDLVRLLEGVSGDLWLDAFRRASGTHPVAAELLDVAGNPWSYVLTSAIDPQVHEAFQRVGFGSRQLRVLFAGQAGTLARSGAGTLTLLRLFGSIDERDPSFRPPVSDLELRRRRQLELPMVLNDLPVLVGPGGQVAVVGVGADDWIDVELLALSCSELPDGSVHWFDTGEAPVALERLRDLFGERLVHYSDSLSAMISAAPVADRASLDDARARLLNPQGRRITVGRGESATVTTFSAAEWRRISQVAVVLDDDVTQSQQALDHELDRQAFKDFLYRVQRVPDWTGVSRGFLFQREAGAALLDRTEQELLTPRSVLASVADGGLKVSRRSSRLPILVEGPPASGKSRLLHWLAFRLREHGHVVVYVPPTRGRSGFEQIERVCRLLETRTDSPCAVIADNLDEAEYDQLAEVLASSGRRSVLVGAINSLRTGHRRRPVGALTEDAWAPESTASYTPVHLDSRLTNDEAGRFLEYLSERGYPDLPFAQEVVQQRLFLLLLYRLLPDSRGNIRLAVAEEYERLVTALERHLDHDRDTTDLTPEWQHQLELVRAELFPELETGEEQAPSVFRHDAEMVTAVQLALLCSLVERPLSLDLLLRTRTSRFLTSYRVFSRAMEETALLQETKLDQEGTIGVESEHPFVADVTLRGLVPDRASQLRLLSDLVKAVRWDETAYPGENVDQDYVVSVLRAVGPRGSSADTFDSRDCLEELASLLSGVRVGHGTRLPQLLLLEANVLRLMADSASTMDSMARFSEAVDILGEAEQILSARRPSASRNSQLQSVLTTRAVVHGYISGACLQEYRDAGQDRRVELREMLRDSLEEVRRDTARARSFGGASYFPLDVSFWAHRDQLEQLPDLTDSERVVLLGKLESVLELAAEEPIELSQYGRFQRRVVDLAQLQGHIEELETIATELRSKGDFSADCIIARRNAIDPATRQVRSPRLAAEGLNDLLGFAPAILGSEEALSLMHHLWIGAHLDGQVIGGDEPVYARCRRDDWITWRRILEARLALPANEGSPYVNFCLAWALLSLSEPVRAMQVFRANEVLAIGNRRRVGTLAVITDESGAPREFSGTVRRIEGQETTLYVPGLSSEIRAPARVRAQLAISVHVGDEWRFGVGLNYQGVLPIPVSL
jgi:hypothetical protein